MWRVSRPLPVPTTSIYTRDDGIVAWQSCCAEDASSEAGAAIEVGGAHVTICRNPRAMATVATRLANGGLEPEANRP